MKEHFFLGKGNEREAELKRIERILEALPADQGYRVEVHETGNSVSLEQRGYLWGVCYPAILRQGGELLAGVTAPELHETCLMKCYGFIEKRVLGRRTFVPAKRSPRGKVAFGEYISWLQSYFAQMGIVIPDPDPEWYLKEVG